MRELAIAIVIGSALIAGSLLYSEYKPSYRFEMSATNSRAWILNTTTGAAFFCDAGDVTRPVKCY